MSGILNLPVCIPRKAPRKRYTLAFATSRNNVVLTTALKALGWDGEEQADVVITVNRGVRIGGSQTTDDPGMRLDALPEGSTITLTNNGIINGRGGPTGNYRKGGDALYVRHRTTLVNNGVIYGGGGGGRKSAPGVFSGYYLDGAPGGVGEGNRRATRGRRGDTYNGRTGNAGHHGYAKGQGNSGYWVNGQSFLSITGRGSVYGRTTG